MRNRKWRHRTVRILYISYEKRKISREKVSYSRSLASPASIPPSPEIPETLSASHIFPPKDAATFAPLPPPPTPPLLLAGYRCFLRHRLLPIARLTVSKLWDGLDQFHPHCSWGVCCSCASTLRCQAVCHGLQAQCPSDTSLA